MNKYDWKKLIFLGISGGLCLSSPGMALENAYEKFSQMNQEQQEFILALAAPDVKKTDPNGGNMGYHLMTESELFLELTPEGIKQYQSLDAEGKKLAIYTASQRCQATNKCAGLNACQDDKHDCAGKGSCEGKGKCAFSDKNLAVKVVAEKMAKKRAEAQSGSK